MKGYRHGHRERQLIGTFGTEMVRVPGAQIEDEAGQVSEWRAKALPRYRRLIVDGFSGHEAVLVAIWRRSAALPK